jgi:hypothetical protein
LHRRKGDLVKKLLAAITVLGSVLAVSSSAHAVTPAASTFDCSTNQNSSLAVTGQVGETFTITNTDNFTVCVLFDMAGVVTPSGAGYNPNGAMGPEITSLGTASFTIIASGVFTVEASGPGVLTVTVTVGAGGGGGGPATVVKGSLDPDGGTCTWNGQPLTKKTEFFVVGFTYAPGPSECVKNGYALTGWREGNGPSLPSLIDPADDTRRYFMAQTGNYVAIWKLVPDAPEFASASSVKPCGPCRIDVSWSSVTLSNVSYEVELWNGDTLLQTVTSSAITTTFSGVAAEKDYTIRLYSVLDGVRSAGPAVTGASTVTAKSITIVCERTTVSGKPGVRCEGYATGLADGSTVVHFLRFPGESSYTRGSARPIVASDGTFEWSRKTGKKAYVYFTTEDGTVQSNRAIVGAL